MTTAQATRPRTVGYVPPSEPRQGTMIHWLARACRELRETAERKQVHVAAAMSVDQSTIYRFELGESWPRQADDVVRAYAEALEIEEQAIWALALRLWREG